MSAPVEISVVVCTRDRCDRLAPFFDAMRALRFAGDWELVIVDDGSRDGTAAALRAFAAAAPMPVTVVRRPARGLGRARNAGIARTRGGIVAFTDDDCYPAPDWLERIAEAFADPSLDYLAGRVELHDLADAPIAVRDTPHAIELPPGGFVAAGLVQGANMAFRRHVVAALGGFDPELGPGTPFCADDVDLAARASTAGFRGRYDPVPIVAHHHRRAEEDAAAVRRAYDRGRGAYYAKLLLARRTRLLAVRHWYWSVLATRGRVLAREMLGAVAYVCQRRVW